MTKCNCECECACETCLCEAKENLGISANIEASTVQECGFSFYTDADEETGSACT